MFDSYFSTLIFSFTVAMFVSMQFAKRAKDEKAISKRITKVLGIIVLSLSAIYFYKKFIG